MFNSAISYAFPEFIRHGYVHCTACHDSPAGGGLLSAYGRSLSKELLSRWSKEGEENILHGVLNRTRFAQWLNSEEDTGFFLGGDLRLIQTHRENEFQRKRSFFPMQADLESAYRADWGSIQLSYGLEKRGEVKSFLLRRFAIVNKFKFNLWSRLGLGTPHFALMTSEHTWSFRQELGFGPLDRRYLGEIEYQGESWGALLGVAASDESLPETSREKSSYLMGDWIFSHNKKAGLHHWSGKSDGLERSLRGLHMLLGWTEHMTTLAQMTFRTQKATGADDQKGWYLFQKTSYEPTKGLWFSLLLDVNQSDQTNEVTRHTKYGAGFQFFPRPHFEVQCNYLRVKEADISSQEGDEGYTILHYYL